MTAADSVDGRVGDLVGHARDAMAKAQARPPAPDRPSTPVPGRDEATVVARRKVLTAAWQAMVPATFVDARLSDYAAAELAEAHELLTRWATEGSVDGQNLVITGPIGAGKTHAGFAAVRGPFGDGTKLMFIPATELLAELDWRNDGARAVMERACSIDLLYVDDLGVERSNDWAQEQWYTIANRRWMDNLPMIVTTNLVPDDLTEHLGMGGRTYSRLRDNAVGVRISGDDRRKPRG